MAELTPDTTQGEDLFDGSQSFFAHDDSADPMSGGAYSHDPLYWSAHEAEALCDWARHINSLLYDASHSIPAVDIDSGTVDGTTIGGTTPAAVTATTLTATTLTDGTVSLSGGTVTGTWADLGTVTTVAIQGGTVDGTTIGGTTPAAVTATTLSASGNVSLSGIPTGDPAVAGRIYRDSAGALYISDG